MIPRRRHNGRIASRPGRPGRWPAVMRESGEEQGHETFFSPVAAHVEEPERLADVVLLAAKERFTDMARMARLSRWCSGRQCVPIPDLELEARVQLSEIVQKGDDREPRFRDGAEIGIARGPLEPVAEDRIAKAAPRSMPQRRRSGVRDDGSNRAISYFPQASTTTSRTRSRCRSSFDGSQGISPVPLQEKYQIHASGSAPLKKPCFHR